MDTMLGRASLFGSVLVLLVAVTMLVSGLEALTLGNGRGNAPSHASESGPPDHAGDPGKPDHAASPRTFEIRGDFHPGEDDFDGLFPGVEATLTVDVVNPHNFDIIVTEVDMSVSGTDGEDCQVSTVEQARGFRGSQEVPARGAEQVEVVVLMKAGATDDCQHATYSLKYTGEAIRANQQ